MWPNNEVHHIRLGEALERHAVEEEPSGVKADAEDTETDTGKRPPGIIRRLIGGLFNPFD